MIALVHVNLDVPSYFYECHKDIISLELKRVFRIRTSCGNTFLLAILLIYDILRYRELIPVKFICNSCITNRSPNCKILSYRDISEMTYMYLTRVQYIANSPVIHSHVLTEVYSRQIFVTYVVQM